MTSVYIFALAAVFLALGRMFSRVLSAAVAEEHSSKFDTLYARGCHLLMLACYAFIVTHSTMQIRALYSQRDALGGITLLIERSLLGLIVLLCSLVFAGSWFESSGKPGMLFGTLAVAIAHVGLSAMAYDMFWRVR